MKLVVGMGMAAIGFAMVAGCVYVPPERRPPPDVYYREPPAVIVDGGHDYERDRDHERERRIEPLPLPPREMERRDRRDERYREVHRRDDRPETGRAVDHFLDRNRMRERQPGRPAMPRPQPPGHNAAQHWRSAGNRQNNNNDHPPSNGQGRRDESSQPANSDRPGD